MKIEINGHLYDVVINKKISTKNVYIRVKEDLTIYVTANKFTSNAFINDLINKNILSISKMIEKTVKRQNISREFRYLGKNYRLVYYNDEDVNFADNMVFAKNDIMLDKWLNKQISTIYKEQLDNIYNQFPYKIPYPRLTIRNMKTKWGVCNTKTHRITLNSSLIKYDLKYLDYVIVHELCHLIHPNHSKLFWSAVTSVMPESLAIRKELKNE